MANGNINPNVHWRDSARPVRFFIVDYKAALVLVLLLLFPSWNLFFITIGLFCFLFVLERYGYSTMVFLRLLRGFFAGSMKSAMPWWRQPKI